MLLANTLFVAGVSVMSLVDTTSILLTNPLIVTALSVPLLGEKVGPRRWACVAAGCVGALIIIRPGFGVMQWAALLPLGAACCFALFQIITRRLSQTDAPLTTLFYTISVGTPVTTLIMPFVWVMPDWQGWLLMAAMGLIGGVSHFTLIKAFATAPAAVVSPFTYTNLLWATVFGFIIFGELPDRWTVIGALIIVVSGLYAFFREQQRKRVQPG
jgi:drug/metabolite transporter (DMT)-like permease